MIGRHRSRGGHGEETPNFDPFVSAKRTGVLNLIGIDFKGQEELPAHKGRAVWEEGVCPSVI